MEWEELRSLHLGSSGGPEAEAFPSSPPEHQRKSQLKISARLGVWRKWQVKEALSCPSIPPTHPPPLFQPEVRTAVMGIQQSYKLQ